MTAHDMPDPSPNSSSAIERLFSSGHKTRYSKGATVLQPEDGAKNVFYIQSGYIKVFSINDRGEEYLHIIYGPGELFPSILIVSPQERSVFYRTISPAVLWHVPASYFLRTVKVDVELTYAVLEQVTKQFNIYTHRVDNLEYKYGRERLVYRLIFLAKRFGDPSANKVTLPPITQQDIAESINLSRESASREIERLEKRGLVSYDGRRLIVNDIKALSREIKGVEVDLWNVS